MNKKPILVMVSAILALTGCENSIENSSVDNVVTSNEVSEEVTTVNNSSDLTAEQIEEIFMGLISDYYKGTEEADFDKCFGNFPDFYLEKLEREVEICEQTHEEYMQSIHDFYVETYGEDFKIEFVVAEDEESTKGILSLDESLNEFVKILKDTFGKDVNLEKAYTIYLSTSTKGSIYSDVVREEWFLLKIDGKYYIYENYYESNSIE